MGRPVKARKQDTPERQVKRAIQDFLNLCGVFWYSNLAGIGGAPGLSDMTGIYRGRYLAIEVKAPGKRIKPGSNQERFLQNVHDQGGIAIECDGVPALVEGFRRYGYEFNVLF